MGAIVQAYPRCLTQFQILRILGFRMKTIDNKVVEPKKKKKQWHNHTYQQSLQQFHMIRDRLTKDLDSNNFFLNLGAVTSSNIRNVNNSSSPNWPLTT